MPTPSTSFRCTTKSCAGIGRVAQPEVGLEGVLRQLYDWLALVAPPDVADEDLSRKGASQLSKDCRALLAGCNLPDEVKDAGKEALPQPLSLGPARIGDHPPVVGVAGF